MVHHPDIIHVNYVKNHLIIKNRFFFFFYSFEIKDISYVFKEKKN